MVGIDEDDEIDEGIEDLQSNPIQGYSADNQQYDSYINDDEAYN